MRKAILAGLFGLATLLAAAPAAAEPIRITDITGRAVELAAPARRLVLAQGRHLNALALLDRDPVKLVAGWAGDLKRDGATYDLYRAAFPAIEQIPSVGQGTAETFSLETVLALKPDLVVLSRGADQGGAGQPDDLAARLEAAGIPVLIIDFFRHPLTETIPSLRMLGQAIGREREAEAYIAFYQEHLERIRTRLADPALRRPIVFVNAHAGGPTCCFSPGKGVFDDFVNAAGGHNIGADILPGATGQLSIEYVMSRNPEIYIGTGGSYLAKSGGLVLGSGIGEAAARASLAGLFAKPGLSALSGLDKAKVHGLWQLFNDTPAHIVAVEAMATWMHPDRFRDVDPNATLAEINSRFLAVPLKGTYLVDLQSR